MDKTNTPAPTTKASKAVTFEQVFWYTNACPMQQVDRPVLSGESPRSLQVRGFVHSTLLALMMGQIDPAEALAYCANLVHSDSPLKHGSWSTSRYFTVLLNMVNAVLWAGGAWNAYNGIKATDMLEVGKKFITHNMQAEVDIVRFKHSGRTTYLNMTWVHYGQTMPTKEERGRLFQYVQYNARAYYLATDTYPSQLDVFFPFLNHTFKFLYTPDASYEVIAELIASGTYYAIPSAECQVCQMCPMTWDTLGLPKRKEIKY